MEHKYYVIASVDEEKPTLPHSSEWPKLVAFSFENMSILIIVGRGHGLMGGEISLSKFNVSDWLDVFRDTDIFWFKDWILDGSLKSSDSEEKLKKVLLSKRGIEIIDY